MASRDREEADLHFEARLLSDMPLAWARNDNMTRSYAEKGGSICYL
jgi:hypothetical protein